MMPPVQNPSPAPLQESVIDRRGRLLSMTTGMIALFGIIPLLIFLLSFAGRFGMIHLLFYFMGVITHGIGFILGLCACFHGRLFGGIFGIFGNGFILLVATLLLLANGCQSRY